MSMRNPRCIRIFDNRAAVSKTVIVLRNAGFDAYSKEDRFGNLTLRMLGMRSRFRLYVDMDDIEKISKFLEKEMTTKL